MRTTTGLIFILISVIDMKVAKTAANFLKILSKHSNNGLFVTVSIYNLACIMCHYGWTILIFILFFFESGSLDLVILILVARIELF